jgi:hypothetical protein
VKDLEDARSSLPLDDSAASCYRLNGFTLERME